MKLLLTTVVQDSMPVGQDKVARTLTVVGRFVQHMLFVSWAFDDTGFEGILFEGTSFGLHTMFVGTAFEGTSFGDTVHMLHMVVARMLAAASADQHMVAHIQSVYMALPVLHPL